jgi:hypothetical protein
LIADWYDYAVPSHLLLRAMAGVERVTRRPAYNVIISNVRGPESLRYRDIPVVGLRSIGPLSGSMGLNLTAWSYEDDFTIGMHACREHVPDLRRLGEHLAAELALFRSRV